MLRSTTGILSSVQPTAYCEISSSMRSRLARVALDELHRVLADRRLPGVGPGVPDPVREDRLDVHAALVGLEEDLEGALAGRVAGSHG